MLILVNSGATHNFISQNLTHKMGWAIEDTLNMIVKMEDGFQTTARWKRKEVEIEIGDFKIFMEAFLFELGHLDVVLGIEWLKTLGNTIVNWTKQTMIFWNGRKMVNLQGLGGLPKHLVDLQCILSRSKGYVGSTLWSLEK